jgi:hypothetical protein
MVSQKRSPYMTTPLTLLAAGFSRFCRFPFAGSVYPGMEALAFFSNLGSHGRAILFSLRLHRASSLTNLSLLGFFRTKIALDFSLPGGSRTTYTTRIDHKGYDADPNNYRVRRHYESEPFHRQNVDRRRHNSIPTDQGHHSH